MSESDQQGDAGAGSPVIIPIDQLATDTLRAVIGEFISRDGTDYGEVELTLEEKTGNLRRQLQCGELQLLFETESEQWDLVDAEQAHSLLNQVNDVD